MTFQEEKAEAIGKALINFQEAIKNLMPLNKPENIRAAYLTFELFKNEMENILAAVDPSRFPPTPFRTVVEPNYKK